MNRACLLAVPFASLTWTAACGAEPLPRSTPEAQGVSSAAVLAFVDAVDKIPQMNSFLLLRRGHVVAEAWWAPFTPADPHMMYSLSKSFTSTAVGLAIAEGRLSLDDPVLSFFPADAPAEPSENLRAMRVRDLLTMSTGHHAEQVPQFKWDGPRPLTRQFLAMPVPHKPGTHFVYNTPATYMASAIVQSLTGEKAVDYLGPRLFEPLGIAAPAWEESADGVSMGGTGLSLRTEDVARFGQLLLQRGTWNNQQLVPAAWIELATSRQTSNGSHPDSDWEQGYGFQFWRCRHGAFRGDGAFGQFCIVMPQDDAVLVITSGVSDMQAVLNAAWGTLLPALQAASGPLAADAASLAKLEQRLGGLHVPTPVGQPTSATAEKLAGAEYEFPANSLEIETLKFEPGDEGALITVRVDGQDYALPCSYGAWTRGEIVPRLGDVRAPGEPARVAASGAWTAPDRYEAKLCLYETPYILALTLAFAGEQVTLDCAYNVSFDGPRPPQVVGRLKSMPAQ
jgi:CubicO group peptidase (beta-lactamase class C family)